MKEDVFKEAVKAILIWMVIWNLILILLAMLLRGW